MSHRALTHWMEVLERLYVTSGRKAWMAVEAKVQETRVDPALACFRERLKIPFAYQVTLEGTRDFVEDGVRVLPASRFLAALI